MSISPLVYARGSSVITAIALLWATSLIAAEPVKKTADSLDDELLQGLDDAVKAPGVKPSPQPTTKPVTPAAKPNNPLDDELLKSLGGDDASPAKKPESPKSSTPPPEGDAPPTPPSDDPFERITQQIRDAEGRLRRVDSGDKTQELQRKIVDDLEKLIAQIEQQQQQQRNQSPSQSKPQSRSQPQPQPGQPQPQAGQGGENSAQARDSQEGTRNSQDRKPDPGRLQSLLEKAWGMLPERERQDVMQSSVDDFPTKYRTVIEEYFKTLLRREE